MLRHAYVKQCARKAVVAFAVSFSAFAAATHAGEFGFPQPNDEWEYERPKLSAESFQEEAYYRRASPSLTFESYTSDGVPLVNFHGDEVVHPVAIAQGMLKYYGVGFSEREEDKEKFEDILLAIIDSDQLNGTGGELKYGFDFRAGTYGHEFKSGWSSAMAQGVMLSVMARGYIIYPELRSRIRRYGARLMTPLQTPATQGGHLYRIKIGDEAFPFYEEYPVPSAPPLTLNGFMFALIGLHEYRVATGSPLAARLFREGVETLIHILPYYDASPLSTYDLSHQMFSNTRHNISPYYHDVHSQLLDYLHEVTWEPVLACVRDSMRAKLDAIERQYGVPYSDLGPEDLSAIKKDTPLEQDKACASLFDRPREVYVAPPVYVGG